MVADFSSMLFASPTLFHFHDPTELQWDARFGGFEVLSIDA